MDNSLQRTSVRSRGFSLIEVTIAMAIAAVAIVTLLGMVPQGMNTMREAGDEAIQGRIHQQILNEIQMTPFGDEGGSSPLDSYNGMEFFYDAQGEELSNTANKNSVSDDRKPGGLAHVYSARLTIPSRLKSKIPASVGGHDFSGYVLDGSPSGDPNPFVRPVIVEIAPVGGREDFEWELESNRSVISTYQTVVVKMDQSTP